MECNAMLWKAVQCKGNAMQFYGMEWKQSNVLLCINIMHRNDFLYGMIPVQWLQPLWLIRSILQAVGLCGLLDSGINIYYTYIINHINQQQSLRFGDPVPSQPEIHPLRRPRLESCVKVSNIKQQWYFPRWSSLATSAFKSTAGPSNHFWYNNGI